MNIQFSKLIIPFIVLLICASFYFSIPWKFINWGKIVFDSQRTIAVTGYAKSMQKNQVATYSAGVSVVNDNKDTAIKEVNDKMDLIISSLKTFGIQAADLQTENLSVYQSETTYYDNGEQKSKPGQWRVSNNVSIKLRDVARASELSDLLAASGATNVYGPNFALDDTQTAEKALLGQALTDARSKAEIIAKSSNGKVGKIISVSEGYASSISPMYEARGMGGGGGSPVETGSETISKTINVVFELVD